MDNISLLGTYEQFFAHNGKIFESCFSGLSRLGILAVKKSHKIIVTAVWENFRKKMDLDEYIREYVWWFYGDYIE